MSVRCMLRLPANLGVKTSRPSSEINRTRQGSPASYEHLATCILPCSKRQVEQLQDAIGQTPLAPASLSLNCQFFVPSATSFIPVFYILVMSQLGQVLGSLGRARTRSTTNSPPPTGESRASPSLSSISSGTLLGSMGSGGGGISRAVATLGGAFSSRMGAGFDSFVPEDEGQIPATPGARFAASTEQHTFDAEANDDVVGIATPTQDPRRPLEATFSPAALD